MLSFLLHIQYKLIIICNLLTDATLRFIVAKCLPGDTHCGRNDHKGWVLWPVFICLTVDTFGPQWDAATLHWCVVQIKMIVLILNIINGPVAVIHFIPSHLFKWYWWRGWCDSITWSWLALIKKKTPPSSCCCCTNTLIGCENSSMRSLLCNSWLKHQSLEPLISLHRWHHFYFISYYYILNLEPFVFIEVIRWVYHASHCNDRKGKQLKFYIALFFNSRSCFVALVGNDLKWFNTF